MKQNIIKFLIFSMLALTACEAKITGVSSGGGGSSQNTPPINFKDQVAQGQINGQAWSFESGKANKGQMNGIDVVFITLWSDKQSGNPCNRMAGSTFMTSLSVPPKVGSYSPGMGNTDSLLILHDMRKPGATENNIVVSEGAIEVTTATSTEIGGRLAGRFEGSGLGLGTSEVNGNFKVPLCP